MIPTRRALARLLLAAAALAAAGCAPDEGQSSCGPTTGKVVEIIDGDTIVLESGEKIRYLMVDTPEITKGHDDCYGTQARDFNQSLVLDKTVSLAYDAECTDRYGRLLAYVTVAGREVNTLMVERGFACVLHISPNGDARATEFKDLQAEAKAQKRGMWGTCDPIPCL